MHIVLQFDYADVDGLKVASCSGIGALKCDDGTWAFDQIIVRLEDDSGLIIRATADTDEVVVDRALSVSSNFVPSQAVGHFEPLDDFNGMELGWCWVGTNWHGYKDMFILSFTDLEPELMFVAKASKIHLYRIGHKL